MVSDTAVTVDSVSKQYRIGRRGAQYKTLRESIVRAVASPLQTRRHGEDRTNDADTIWALKDVSFEVKRGEAIGIIGRNGAGKSTLLKILSRITRPTAGRAAVFGRVGSLLEVGTGFHPELTGRENIFLNGAILGMRRAEIERKFAEIVEFAEIEKFLDMPVKHYSSGMYVRLAFSVAAHLEPEILLVDEVLAVGDVEFQKKCMGKMNDVATGGRTVVFVSHNMAAVQQLCSRGLTFDQGRVSFLGPVTEAVSQYLSSIKTIQMTPLAEREDRTGSQWLRFSSASICDQDGRELHRVLSGQDIEIRFCYHSSKVMNNAQVVVAFNVRSPQGQLLLNLNSVDSGSQLINIYRSGMFKCRWPRFNLRAGSYDCALFCSINGEIVDWLQSAFAIEVEDGDYFRTGRLVDRSQGDVLVSHSWSSSPS